MANGANVAVPLDYPPIPAATFIAANGVLGKIVLDKLPVGGGGNQGLSLNPLALGGGRLLDLTAVSSDAAAKSLLTYIGYETTVGSNMGTVTTTATTNATVTRTSGSFVTDGWAVGDLCMAFGSAASGNNGNLATVTTVAAGTLTFNGVPSGFTANSETAALRLFRVVPKPPIAVPVGASAGVVATTNTTLLAALGIDNTLDRTGIWLGASEVVIVAPVSAVAALPAYISVFPRVARY